MIEDIHGTYSGSIYQNIPNGYGIKTYKTGQSIQGNWSKGRPEGQMLYTSPFICVDIIFKKGIISRIITKIPQVSIQFPYKFIQAGNNFKEISDDSNNSWYSVLRLEMNYHFFQKPRNIRLKNVSKNTLSNNSLYFGEINDFRLFNGFAILIQDRKTFYGIFDFPLLDGYIRSETELFKGNFISEQLNGPGYVKCFKTQLKFKGNFESHMKHGEFQIFLENFRIEVRFFFDQVVSKAKYYKNSNFLMESYCDDIRLEPKEDYRNISGIVEFCEIVQRNCESFDESNQKHYSKKITSRLKLPDTDDWIVHELMLAEKKIIPLKFKDEPIKVIKFNSNHQYKGCTLNGKIHGYGKYFYSSHDYYIGYFNNNKREGFGIFYKNGKMQYRGYWKENKFHNKGQIVVDNLKITGIWEKGILKKIINIFNIN